MNTFWILWVFNTLMALVPLYFFFVGIGDGTVSSRNIMMWLLILLAVAIVVGGSLLLKSMNQMTLAKGILIVAAIPGILAIIFYGIVIIGKPRWN